MALMRMIGMMSGTSMDGIDLAMLETDGEASIRICGGTASLRYSGSQSALIRQAVAEAAALEDRAARPGALAKAETMLTQLHAELVSEFLQAENIPASSITAIGFHGHTVLHRPNHGITVQLGDGQALAEATDIPVVHDLRAADVAAGGQGAPLVPIYHQALAVSSKVPRPVAILNLGGVGNVTFVGQAGDLLAFDTGPGNALIDDLVRERTGHAMDEDGRLALAGHIDEAALATLMAHPFFAARPPKSLDRNAFAKQAVDPLGLADAAATLTAFTAAAVARAQEWFPASPEGWVVCGGGVRNPALLAALEARLASPVIAADTLGWSSGFMEAQAFAYLAARSLKGLPISFPTTTGIAQPLTGGRLSMPSRRAA